MTVSKSAPGEPTALPQAKKRRQWVHLLWAVPLSLPFAALLAAEGVLTRCGIGPCNGGGFGHAPSEPVLSALFFAGSALALALPFAAVPWARRSIRLTAAAVIATIAFTYWWTGVS